MPSQVKVGPVRYRIVGDSDEIAKESEKHAKEGEWTAFSDHNLLLICINPNHPEDATKVTVLHEILHCCLMLSGIWLDQYAVVVGRAKGRHGGYGVEEAAVTGISACLLGVLRDNPELMAWLAS